MDENVSVPHPKWLRTYVFAQRRRVTDRETVELYLFNVTIAGFPVLN